MKTLNQKSFRRLALVLLVVTAGLVIAPVTLAQDNLSANGKTLYDQIKAATLMGGSAQVTGLVLKRDRAEMVFDGVFYFGVPVEGRVTTAVFIGKGGFRAQVPPTKFERDNLKRMLGTDAVDSDFTTAVLRFSDDTFELIGKKGLPSYQLEYQMQDQPDGSVVLTGNILQEDVAEDWFMILPVVMYFDGNQAAIGTVHAVGPKTPFTIKLPRRPRKVELDPQKWIPFGKEVDEKLSFQPDDYSQIARLLSNG